MVDKLGPDGLPTPKGNEAQRLAGLAVRATFDKKAEDLLAEKNVVPVNKKEELAANVHITGSGTNESASE